MKETMHRHSTFFGFATSALVTVLLGTLTHWSWAVMLAASCVSICIFPRAFYGWADKRALDRASADPDSFVAKDGCSIHDMAGIGTRAFHLERAFEESRFASSSGYDPSGKIADSHALEKYAANE